MSRNTKIVLGVVAGLLFLACLCAGTIAAGVALFTVRATSVSVSPERIELAAERIGGFAPAGWRSDYTVRIGELEVVGYKPESGDGHIIFAYFGPDSHGNVDELITGIQKGIGGRYTWMDEDMAVVERRKVLLGEQEAEVVITEGKASGRTWRQAIVAYQSARGFTVAALGLPAAQWSEAKLDEFIFALR